MPGPAPKDPAQRRRRNKPAEVTALPAAGRQAPAPRWPISGPSDAEAEIWAELWATPQAVAWESLGWTRIVARYARVAVAAECGEGGAMILAECRQLEDRLGLSPMAMKRLQWQVEDLDEPVALASVTMPDRWKRTGS